MLKDEYKVYEEKMSKSIDSVSADFARPPVSRDPALGHQRREAHQEGHRDL